MLSPIVALSTHVIPQASGGHSGIFTARTSHSGSGTGVAVKDGSAVGGIAIVGGSVEVDLGVGVRRRVGVAVALTGEDVSEMAWVIEDACVVIILGKTVSTGGNVGVSATGLPLQADRHKMKTMRNSKRFMDFELGRGRRSLYWCYSH